MIGRRREGVKPWEMEPGDYMKSSDGEHWWLKLPSGGLGQISNKIHEITEHEDGTITVSPSILSQGGGTDDWHGFLERGVWRSC